MHSQLRIGSWITVPHPTIVDLVAETALDWVCVDLEHSPVSTLDLQTAVAIIQGHQKKAFVRVRQNSHVDIKYPLDSGVDGIIIPMVNSAKEAEQAISHCLYPPKGQRGVGLARAQRFGFGFEQHLRKNLSELEIILQIEHINAVQELTQILKLDNLTGIFVGPYDLSGSMGIPGQFDHPSMKEALTLIAEKTLAAGKYLGAHVIAPDHKVLQQYRQMGYNFIAFSIDTYFLGQKLRDELNLFKG